MITVRCFDSFERAAFLRDEADALNRRSARPDPFSTFDFGANFLRHDESHPGGLGLWLLAAFRADRLVGYVALRRVTHRVLGLPSATIGFLVSRDTDRPHVVARPEDLPAVSEAFYRHLLERRGEWSLLEFAQQDADSSLFPPPAGVDLRAHLVREWPSLENGSVRIRWDSVAAYTQAMPRKFRANLARQLQGLLGAGRVELLASSDPQSTPALFELCLAIEPHSWKSRAAADLARSAPRLAYFRSLLDAAQPMRVSILVLLLDGVPFAGLISGAFMTSLYALHMVYDERLSRLGPGSVMMLLGVREAIEGRFAHFNMLSGFGYYKSRWLADITETRIAQIYRRGSLPHWHRLLGDTKRRLWARTTPALHHNPVRRAVLEHLPEPAALPVAERERIATLVARARRGTGEFLSPAELAAALPLRPAR